MESEPKNSNLTENRPRWVVGALALVLIGLELSQISTNYRVVEAYAPPHATGILDAVDRLAVAHALRIVLIATLLTGWRWSLWVAGLSFLVVYLPNPWVSGTLMNSISAALFFLPISMVALWFDKRLLFPWRTDLKRYEVSQPQGLISVLLDHSAEFGDRHDAAMDLAAFDDTNTVAALTQIKNDPREDPDIVEEAAQSLLEIHARAESNLRASDGCSSLARTIT